MALTFFHKRVDLGTLLTVSFAVLLQVQVTIFASETYAGLRVNAADFLIPIVGIIILYSLARKKSSWPHWRSPFGYWCLVLIAGLLGYGLINGFLLMGELSRWALLNKFIGWFVICGYIGAAGWLATNGYKCTIQTYYRTFLSSFCVLSFISLVHFFLYWEQGIETFGPAPFNFQAFMFNRNSYAFLFVTIILSCMFIASHHDKAKKAETLLHLSLWLMLPTLTYFNGSRALWLCLLLLIPLTLIYYKTLRLRHVLICLAIGSAFAFTLFPNSLPKGLQAFHQSIMLFVSEENRISVAKRLNTQKNYNHVRYMTLETGWELIQKHPIRGAGLGSILKAQIDENAKMVSVLDNTLLWVLVEMGPLGLLSFLLVYVVMLKAIVGKTFKDMSDTARLGLSLLLFFGFFSMLHEILYTRFFWFICAMLLVTPVASKMATTEKQPR